MPKKTFLNFPLSRAGSRRPLAGGLLCDKPSSRTETLMDPLRYNLSTTNIAYQLRAEMSRRKAGGVSPFFLLFDQIARYRGSGTSAALAPDSLQPSQALGQIY